LIERDEKFQNALVYEQKKSGGESGMDSQRHIRFFPMRYLRFGLVIVLLFMLIVPASAQFTGEPTQLSQAPPQAGAQFGATLATGDVNGDGFADLLVGAPLADVNGQADAGQVFVYFGPSLGGTPTTLQAPAPQAGAHFGLFLTTGNVNGDGFADILVGAPDGGAGALYVFHGGQPLDATSDRTLQAPMPEAGARFGISAGVGDFNADMMPDIVVGANRADVTVTGQMQPTVDAGQAYIFFGPGFDPAMARTLQAMTPEAGAHFGTAIATGDVNADRFSDIIVSGDRTDVMATGGTEVNAGEAVVFFGAAMSTPPAMFSPTISVTLREVTIQRGAAFGRAVAVGDITGDGTADIIIGAPLLDASPSIKDVGELTVYVGAMGLTGTPTGNATIRGPIAANAYFGLSVALGDVNGDGLGDIVAGSPGSEVPGFPSAGRAFVFLSGTPLMGALNTNVTLQAPDPGSNAGFGQAVAVADFDGNGVADMAVGAPGATVGGVAGAGRVYVFFSTAPIPPLQ
jgi:hypothetical protein